MTKYIFSGASRAPATPAMKLFVSLVNGFQPLTNVLKNSNLDAVGILDTPLHKVAGCKEDYHHRNMVQCITAFCRTLLTKHFSIRGFCCKCILIFPTYVCLIAQDNFFTLT